MSSRKNKNKNKRRDKKNQCGSSTTTAQPFCFLSQAEALERLVGIAQWGQAMMSLMPDDARQQLSIDAADVTFNALRKTRRAELAAVKQSVVQFVYDDGGAHGSPTALDDSVVLAVVNDRVKKFVPTDVRKQVHANTQMICCVPDRDLVQHACRFALCGARIVHIFLSDHMIDEHLAANPDSCVSALVGLWDQYQVKKLPPTQAMLLFEPLTTDDNDTLFATGALISKTVANLLDHYGRLDAWWREYVVTGGVLAAILDSPLMYRRLLESCWLAVIGTCFVCNCRIARRLCGRCQRMRYCDADCQLRDWPRHRKYCRPQCSESSPPAAAAAAVAD